MSEKIAEAVNGFEALKARQVSLHNWRVLSWRNDDVTAHKVNLAELSCTCPDHTYNKQDGQICDHLAVALFQAPGQLDVGDAIRHDLAEKMIEVDDHIQALERKATGIAADGEANGSGGDSNSSGGGSAGFNGDPVEAMNTVIANNGLDPDDFDIYLHDEMGSVQIETKTLSDADYDTWTSFAVDADWLNWDGDNYVNYVKPADFDGVFG